MRSFSSVAALMGAAAIVRCVLPASQRPHWAASCKEEQMQNKIPTIEELLHLPKRELDAIFRKASAVAGDATKEPQAREAATKTVDNVRRCQIRPPTP